MIAAGVSTRPTDQIRTVGRSRLPSFKWRCPPTHRVHSRLSRRGAQDDYIPTKTAGMRPRMRSRPEACPGDWGVGDAHTPLCHSETLLFGISNRPSNCHSFGSNADPLLVPLYDSGPSTGLASPCMRGTDVSLELCAAHSLLHAFCVPMLFIGIRRGLGLPAMLFGGVRSAKRPWE